MSTITKQWLQQTIAEYEANRDELPFGLDTNSAIELQAFKLALASLEAEPVCVIDQANLDYLNSGSDADVWPASRTQMGDVLLYRAAPPAPVSVPTFEEWCELTKQKPVGWVRDAMKEAYDGCRSAMLQGVENGESATTMKTAPALDSSPKIDESPSGNSPVIPDGWVMVPVEPTYQMCKAMGLPWESPRFPDLYKAMIAAAPHFREISNSSTKHFRGNAETSTKCWCHTCRPVTNSDMRFVVCPDCGNKRCPHANDHRNACTGSNEPGQEGSAYPAGLQQEVK